jgi:ACS family glucarate transporter-like MFS transporter
VNAPHLIGLDRQAVVSVPSAEWVVNREESNKGDHHPTHHFNTVYLAFGKIVRMSEKYSETNYRWYILILAALTNAMVVTLPYMCLPVLFAEISRDLNLSLIQVGLIWGIWALPSILISLIGGAIADRFGPKRVLIMSCLLVGLTGALRGLSYDFVTLAGTIFLFGLLSPIPVMNTFKTCGFWFSRRQLGLANGFLSMGMALGSLVGSMVSATLLSPLLGGWRNVLFIYGAIAVALGISWYFTRSAPDTVDLSVDKTSQMSISHTISHVARIRNVWLLGLTGLGISGCIQGTLGYLPLYLRGIGWPDVSADGTSAAFHTASMLCVIPIALWSDKIGSRKKVLIRAALSIILGISLLAVVNGVMVWVAVVIAGFVRDGFMAVFMTMIIETDGVGAAYAGTATGLMLVLLGIGNMIAPPLGNSLAGIAPSLPFLFWATLAMAGFMSLYRTTERNA